MGPMVLEKERVFLFFGLFCLSIFLMEKVQCVWCLCIYGMIPGVGRSHWWTERGWSRWGTLLSGGGKVRFRWGYRWFLSGNTKEGPVNVPPQCVQMWNLNNNAAVGSSASWWTPHFFLISNHQCLIVILTSTLWVLMRSKGSPIFDLKV